MEGVAGPALLVVFVLLTWLTNRERPDRQFGKAEDEAKARSYGDDSMDQT